MFTACKPLILASTSPRRQQLLRDLGLSFTVMAA
ncbi:MAG: septum formation inhibitor Maf, partial [Candidatus Electrothrix sp. EH2]|nr:septum formation inhibitor Maf [Candidatus Electrothrix sp. EH2]